MYRSALSAEHGPQWWDEGGVCCCCGGNREGGGGEGGGRAGRDGYEVPNSSIYPGSISLNRQAENYNIILMRNFSSSSMMFSFLIY